MKITIIIWSFIAGSATGAVLTSVVWSRMCTETVTVGTLTAEKNYFLNDYAHDCILAQARKGLNEKDPATMESIKLVYGAYHVATFWKNDPKNEQQVPYDLHRKDIMLALGLDQPSDFSELEIIEQVIPFVDLEGNRIDENIDLVIRFLSEKSK